MSRLLAQVYPEHDRAADNHPEKFATVSGRKSQFLLKSALKALFSTEGKAFICDN
jgi:hypothetical protein